MQLTELQRQIVRKARERINDPEHWCQRTAAQTRGGEHCKPYSAIAFRFCAIGALIHAALPFHDADYNKAFRTVNDIALELLGGTASCVFNDTHNHAAVLSLFDKALA
jgi:hypothetical protein